MTSREKDPISNFRATFIFVSFASNFFLVLARKNMLLLLAENECLHGGLRGEYQRVLQIPVNQILFNSEFPLVL